MGECRARWRWIVAFAILGSLTIMWAWGHAEREWFVYLGGLLTISLPLIFLADAHHRAKKAFHAAFFAERGFDGEATIVSAEWAATTMVPLFRDVVGRTVRLQCAAHGIVRGYPADAGILEVNYDKGDNSYTEQAVFVAFRIPAGAATRHPAVSVRERPGFGGSADQLLKWGCIDGPEVSFESVEVHERYVIRVGDDAEDVTTRELIGPQLLAYLCENDVLWDQRGDVLVVFRSADSRLTEFDACCDAAATIARAYWMDQE